MLGPTTPKSLHCPQSPDVLVRKPPTPPMTARGVVQVTVNSCEGIGKVRLVLGGGSGIAGKRTKIVVLAIATIQMKTYLQL